MSFSDNQLETNITKTLADSFMHKVNFKAKGFTVGTMHYLIVSALIKRGDIKCKVDSSEVTNGAAAVYNAGKKTIFALTPEAPYADVKKTYVHECTHALLHLLGWGHARPSPFKVKVLTNETLAFIGGAMYLAASPQKILANGAGPDQVAYRIVTAKGLGNAATNASSPIDFTDQELAPLEKAIKASAFYSKSWNIDDDMSS